MPKTQNPKRLIDLTANIPNRFILDGTLKKLTGLEHFIYDCILMRTNYDSGVAYITYEEIKNLTGITNGSFLKQKLENLKKYGLIRIAQIPKFSKLHQPTNLKINVYEAIGRQKPGQQLVT